MPRAEVRVGKMAIGRGHPLVVVAGPCVIETEELCLEVASVLREMTAELGIPYIFKASYDKANRSSVKSFRGPGSERGRTPRQGVICWLKTLIARAAWGWLSVKRWRMP